MLGFERFMNWLMMVVCQALTIDAADVTRRRERDRGPADPRNRPDAMEA